jgi:hypothetical protein
LSAEVVALESLAVEVSIDVISMLIELVDVLPELVVDLDLVALVKCNWILLILGSGHLMLVYEVSSEHIVLGYVHLVFGRQLECLVSLCHSVVEVVDWIEWVDLGVWVLVVLIHRFV